MTSHGVAAGRPGQLAARCRAGPSAAGGHRGLAALVAVVVALVLLVTACSLPSLRAATRLSALRTE